MAGYLPLIMVGAACCHGPSGGIAGLDAVTAPPLRRAGDPPQPGLRGQPATGVLTVTNSARRRSPGMVVLEHFGETVVPVTIPSLPRGGTLTRPYRLPTDRRGVFQVGPLTISRSDPFQLMRIGQQQRSQGDAVGAPFTTTSPVPQRAGPRPRGTDLR